MPFQEFVQSELGGDSLLGFESQIEDGCFNFFNSSSILETRSLVSINKYLYEKNTINLHISEKVVVCNCLKNRKNYANRCP